MSKRINLSAFILLLFALSGCRLFLPSTDVTLHLSGFPSLLSKYDILIEQYAGDKVKDDEVIRNVSCDSSKDLALKVKEDIEFVGVYLFDGYPNNSPCYFWILANSSGADTRSINYWMDYSRYVYDDTIEFGCSRKVATTLTESHSGWVDFDFLPYLLFSCNDVGEGWGDARTFADSGTILIDYTFNTNLHGDWYAYDFTGVDPQSTNHVQFRTDPQGYVRVRPADYSATTSGGFDISFWYQIETSGLLWRLQRGGGEYEAFAIMTIPEGLGLFGLDVESLRLEKIVNIASGLGASEFSYLASDNLIYMMSGAYDTIPIYRVDVAAKTISALNPSEYVRANHIAIAQSANRIITVFGNLLSLYDLDTGNLVGGPFDLGVPYCGGLFFDDSRGKLYFGNATPSPNCTIRRYTIDGDTLNLEKEQSVGLSWGGMDMSPDGTAISVLSDGKLKVYGSTDFSLQESIPNPENPMVPSNRVAYSPQGDLIYCGNGQNGGLYLTSTSDYSLVRSLFIPYIVYSSGSSIVPTSDGVATYCNRSDGQQLYFIHVADAGSSAGSMSARTVSPRRPANIQDLSTVLGDFRKLPYATLLTR